MRIWEKAGDFDPLKGSALAWMATIARNRALDEVRRVRPASLEDQPEGFEPAADEVDPLAARERSEGLAALIDCLQGLDEEKRAFSCSPIIAARAARRSPSASGAPCRRSRPGCIAASPSSGTAWRHDDLARRRLRRGRICARHARPERAGDAGGAAAARARARRGDPRLGGASGAARRGRAGDRAAARPSARDRGAHSRRAAAEAPPNAAICRSRAQRQRAGAPRRSPRRSSPALLAIGIRRARDDAAVASRANMSRSCRRTRLRRPSR